MKMILNELEWIEVGTSCFKLPICHSHYTTDMLVDTATVSNENHCSCQFRKIGHYSTFSFPVQTTCSFIKNQDWLIGQESPCYS